MIYRLAALSVLLLAVVGLAAPPQAPLPPQAPPLLEEPKPKPQPKVAPAPSPKLGWVYGGYQPTHDCPVCGRPQYVQSGQNRDGTHNHTCRYDGAMWRH